MDIGGFDLPLLSVARDRYEPRAILRAIASRWPSALFQDANAASWTPVETLLAEDGTINSREFFAFPDESSAQDWAEHGATEANANTMLHILARDDPQDPGLIETTLVVDDLDKDMLAIYGVINSALQDLQQPRTGNSMQKRRTVEAELRLVGASLKREEFSALVEELRATLYPSWTQDELACHPHDALQFCEVVRSRVRAPVPDHLIMRVMLSRRKQGTAGKP